MTNRANATSSLPGVDGQSTDPHQPRCMAMWMRVRGGFWTLVDDDVYLWASEIRWQPLRSRRSGHVYARATETRNKKTVAYQLHRRIMSAPPGLQVDHINGDTLDNRRENLRLVTGSQNQQNMRGARRDSTVGVRNVRVTRHGRYQVRLKVDGRDYYLGAYATLREADEAAQAARRQYMTHAPECEA